MRGARDAARLITVAVVVLSALALVALAARSDRAPTLAPKPVATPTSTATLPAETRTPVPDGGRAEPAQRTPLHQPTWEIWLVTILAMAMLLLALAGAPAMLYLPGIGQWFDRWRRSPQDVAPEVDDEVAPPPLADAVAEGLRELDQGGPGVGVVACWVQLERAAADAGTHRTAPETASELVGRLIDRHPVSSGPLLRLADLYREARYSRHELPEAARDEARAALEQLRTELEASPVSSRRLRAGLAARPAVRLREPAVRLREPAVRLREPAVRLREPAR